MPIISNFPGGSGSGGGGLALAPVTDISTMAGSGEVYVKWNDPEDMVVAGATLAAWSGTLLVRKAGSMPHSRRDGTIVLDSKVRNQYSEDYFCDSGLTNGVTYYYKFFPYTTANAYTENDSNGFSITPGAVYLDNVSNISVEEVGNGKLALKWTDPAATIVQNGVTVATWDHTTVVVKTSGYAIDPNDADAVYTKNVTTRNEYSSNPLVISGLTNGVTYYIALFPITTDGAVTAGDANYITGIPNRLTIPTIPSQKGEVVYSGNPQSPEWNGYDSIMMTISGVTIGTNAGDDYEAKFTPTTDYRWADGSVETKTVKWSISKADSTITFDKPTVTLNSSNLTETVTVSHPDTGTITAESNNTNVATASVNGNILTISHVGQTTGEATITVHSTGDSNYNAPSGATITVNAQFMPASGNALNDYTWDEISQVSNAGLGDDYWNVGDRKAVTINGTVGTLAVNTTLYAYIIGFNHNSAREGNGIQFGTFKTALSGGADVCLTDNKYNSSDTSGAKYFNINHWSYNNYGGWKACDLRYDVLGSTKTAPKNYGKARASGDVGYDAPADTATNPVANTLMAALPADLRAVMKPITKYTDNVAGGSGHTASNVTSSVDYLPLLSEFEIFASSSYANNTEKNYQAQYAYYKAGNSKVKNRHSATSSTASWWERSPRYTDGNRFCNVYTNGGANGSYSGYSYGLAPAFMV